MTSMMSCRDVKMNLVSLMKLKEIKNEVKTLGYPKIAKCLFDNSTAIIIFKDKILSYLQSLFSIVLLLLHHKLARSPWFEFYR